MYDLSAEAVHLLPLAVALAVGLIIAVDHGWHGRARTPEGAISDVSAGSNAAARTFSLLGLFGGVAVLLGGQIGPTLLAAALLALALLLTAAYLLTTWFSRAFGATTETVLLLTCALGALAGTGLLAETVTSAVVAALLGVTLVAAGLVTLRWLR